jgi:hypothetical protein
VASSETARKAPTTRVMRRMPRKASARHEGARRSARAELVEDRRFGLLAILSRARERDSEEWHRPERRRRLSVNAAENVPAAENPSKESWLEHRERARGRADPAKLTLD